MKVIQWLRALLLPALAFLAAVSVHINPGGVLVLQFPPLGQLISNVDLYAAGLLVVIEVFLRLAPTTADVSLLTWLQRLLNLLVPNRSADGGRFLVSTSWTPAHGLSL